MAKGKTPKPIKGPFDERLEKEYKDMKRLADELGGQYQKNLDVSYEPKSTLRERTSPKLTVEGLMKKKGYNRELAENIVRRMDEVFPDAGKGYKSMGEAVGDFVEGATYLPRTAYYGYKDVISNLMGKDVGDFTPGTSRTPQPYMFTAGEGADFQRRQDIRTGVGRPEKIQYKGGGRVSKKTTSKKAASNKVRGAGIAQRGIRKCKMVKAK